MNFDELTRDDLLTVRVKCDRSLLYFTKFWFRVLKGQKFIVNHHHETICKHLEDTEKYNIELLNINIPPRFSKTELAAVNFIARGVGMNPTSNWLYITASDELRAQTSVSIRDIVQHPYFRIMYGVELKNDQNGKNLWRTKQGGGLKTATIFGQVTGFGAGQMHDKELEEEIRVFEGAIVLDDINKIDDSGQENALNDKVTRVIFNTILSRKNSSDTPIMNIQQRAGTSDATQKFMEHYKDNKKAIFLVMPVISPDGIPLWGNKLDLDEIENLRTSEATAHVFETQYMQNPEPLFGYLIPISAINLMPNEHEKDFIRNIVVIDPAEKNGDPMSAIFINLSLINNRFSAHVYDVVHSIKGFEYCCDVIHSKAIETNVSEVIFEKNGVGLASGIALQNLLKKEDTALYKLTPYHSSQNKEAKILANYEFVNQRFTFNSRYEENKEFVLFMKHLTRYSSEGNNNGIKDAMDVCCSASKILKVMYKNLIS